MDEDDFGFGGADGTALGCHFHMGRDLGEGLVIPPRSLQNAQHFVTGSRAYGFSPIDQFHEMSHFPRRGLSPAEHLPIIPSSIRS